ncbi:MICOS complex subunit mic19 [Colletotrichum truncatum]|uniref:MICOS complex subunit mic19 n=1 Tax=Colletotrichum truncatum TaxID=5467 RepID=A0ACC3Z038_COLTU|nr:MICOS complex subunit mic19 [Colletotrichum truncatum]KAF6800806.1 MICOS complex subunit mic19 [Colletotrichum truncatum]
MGASESKPSSNTPPHLWKAPPPSGISHDLVEHLQTSPETDASRAQLSELQVQARVAEELKRLQAKESEALKLAHEKIAAEEKPAPEGQRSHESVTKEIEALRTKLAERKKIRELPQSVETARSEVVRCLRENDRRPLDCWKEVEAFKEEVKRLEKGWVEKVVS